MPTPYTSTLTPAWQRTAAQTEVIVPCVRSVHTRAASVTHNNLLACRRQAQQDVEFDVPKQKRRVRGLLAMLLLCHAMCLLQNVAPLASKLGLSASLLNAELPL